MEARLASRVRGPWISSKIVIKRYVFLENDYQVFDWSGSASGDSSAVLGPALAISGVNSGPSVMSAVRMVART